MTLPGSVRAPVAACLAAASLTACTPQPIAGTGTGTAGASGAPGSAAGTGAAPGSAGATAGPAPAAPSPEALGYRAEEVSFASPAPGAAAPATAAPDAPPAEVVSLAGTLLVPVGATPSANVGAVILVAGSGPTDRDWNNPLLPGKVDTGRVLAERLAAGGLATLRYDKRGIGASTKVIVARWGDFDADLRAARDFLAARAEIDPARIGVLGHSEGAMLAAKAIAEAPPGTFAALAHVAGPGRKFADILRTQVRDTLSRDKTPGPALEASVAFLDDALAKIARGETPGDPGGAVSPLVGELTKNLAAGPNVDFVRGWLLHDPAATIARVPCPVLLGVGAHDAQVQKVDLDALSAALGAAKHPDHTIKVWADTDHVLKIQPKAPSAMTSPEIALSYGDATRLVSLPALDSLREFFGRTLGAAK